MTDHLDDEGVPCRRHAAIAESRLYELAVVGSRVPGFHHDCASKLQSLMMALDEIGELADHADAELRVAANTANTALRELHALLTVNRALAKPPQPARIAVTELIRTAAARVGVKVTGGLAADVEVAIPAMTHAIAMILDLIAGPIQLGRTVEARLELEGGMTLALTGPSEALASPPANANEVVAIAAFVIERDGGQLRCKRDGNTIVVRLPVRK